MFLLIFTALGSEAQILYRAYAEDSVNHRKLGSINAQNMTTKQGTIANNKGYFELSANYGDFIVLKLLGYKNKIIQVKPGDETKIHLILMDLKPVITKEITIRKGPTEYQKDSIYRAEYYGKIYGYERQKSVFTPITSLYQKFSKKHKNIKRFQDQIVNMEKDMYVDSKYTPELVNQLTALDGDELTLFMKQYPMEYAYARVASDLEIKMWIKYNFADYQNKHNRK